MGNMAQIQAEAYAAYAAAVRTPLRAGTKMSKLNRKWHEAQPEPAPQSDRGWRAERRRARYTGE